MARLWEATDFSEPNAVMAEIRRVLKPCGILLAPTFVHGESAGYRLRVKIMEFGGFKTYHKWDAEKFAKYIEDHGFTIKEQGVIGSRLTPLCCVIAEKK